MSCIDLITCTNQNIISKYGADASIFGQFTQYHLLYGKIDIPVPLTPKYVADVWGYSKADVQNIKKYIKNFSWGNTLESLFLLLH